VRSSAVLMLNRRAEAAALYLGAPRVDPLAPPRPIALVLPIRLNNTCLEILGDADVISLQVAMSFVWWLMNNDSQVILAVLFLAIGNLRGVLKNVRGGCKHAQSANLHYKS